MYIQERVCICIYIQYILMNGTAMVKMMQVRPHVDTILFCTYNWLFYHIKQPLHISLSRRPRDRCTTTSSIRPRKTLNFAESVDFSVSRPLTRQHHRAPPLGVGRRRGNGPRGRGLGAECGGTSVRPASCSNSVCAPVDFSQGEGKQRQASRPPPPSGAATYFTRSSVLPRSRAPDGKPMTRT